MSSRGGGTSKRSRHLDPSDADVHAEAAGAPRDADAEGADRRADAEGAEEAPDKSAPKCELHHPHRGVYFASTRALFARRALPPPPSPSAHPPPATNGPRTARPHLRNRAPPTLI
jgi:hypothetical protein